MTVSQQNWVSSNRGDSPTSNRKWLQNRRQPVTPPPSDRVVISMADNRKRKHCWNSHTKQKCVEGGLSGLFITCEAHEKQALNEAYNIIDELLENDAPKDGVVAKEESDEDVADSLKRVCEESRQIPKNKRRCRQRPTGVKNCLFITVRDVDVVDLAEKMVTFAQATPRCRHLQRVLPVEETADCDLKKMSEMILACVGRHLKPDADGKVPSYALEFKTRNNDSVTKAIALEMLGDAVTAIAPSAKVNLSSPDILFFVQLVRKTLMVAGIRDYYQKRKYSMRHTAQPKEEAEKKVCADDASQ